MRRILVLRNPDEKGQYQVKPYIKKDSPLRGENRPGIVHAKGMLKMDQRRQKEEVKATRRALKKAARREGKKAVEDVE